MPSTKTASAPAARVYDPEQLYDVALLRVATWNGLTFSPGMENQLKGKICADIDADIAEASPVKAVAV